MASQCSAKYESRTTLLSHHESPLSVTATRRRQREDRVRSPSSSTKATSHTGFHSRALLSLFVVLFSWSSMCAAVTTAGTHGDRPVLRVEDDLAWTGSSLYLDQRPPPIAPLLMPPVYAHDDATRTGSAPPSKRAIATDSSSSSTDFAIPQPFDTGLSSNFTTSCASYLNKLRTNSAFKQCHPFSLLLQTSSSFFDASKSYLRITQTLDATCGVNATQCRTTLDGFAKELVSTAACKSDYEDDNPLVLQAYNGLVAYQPLYQASCTRDSAGSYCFANAVSNSTSPSDAYTYYLPIGQELPGGSRVTCNSCLQQAMSVFAGYGNNLTQPVSKTYTSAAQQIAIVCGSSFVNVTAAPLKGAAPTTSPTLTPSLALLLMFFFYIFQ